MTMGVIMRVAAVVCFVLAVFNVSPFGLSPVPLGLALWCAATFAGG